MVYQFFKDKKDYQTIYMLAIILFVAGYLHIFKDNGKNYALIYFSIITIIWGITAQYRFYKPNYKEIGFKIEIPKRIKCTFDEDKCEQGDINLWSVAHFVIYFIAGLLFPNRFIFFLIISFVCEFFELKFVHYNAKWILDPTINMLGYVIGSLLVDFIK